MRAIQHKKEEGKKKKKKIPIRSSHGSFIYLFLLPHMFAFRVCVILHLIKLVHHRTRHQAIWLLRKGFCVLYFSYFIAPMIRICCYIQVKFITYSRSQDSILLQRLERLISVSMLWFGGEPCYPKILLFFLNPQLIYPCCLAQTLLGLLSLDLIVNVSGVVIQSLMNLSFYPKKKKKIHNIYSLFQNWNIQ